MYLHTYEYKNDITILIKYYVSVFAQLVEWSSNMFILTLSMYLLIYW